MTVTTFQIGSTLEGLQDLEDILYLGPCDPDWSFQPYSKNVNLGNGHVLGQGFAIAKWRWNVIDDNSREVLRAFVGSNLSATVYISTKTNSTADGDATFATYQAILKWPTVDEDFQVDKVLGLILTFTHLVLVP